jgi:thiol-disulfide isomerase/thioredoxin
MVVKRCKHLLRQLLCMAFLNGLTAVTLAMAATPGEVPVGSNLREAPMQGLLGPSGKLSGYQGKPLIINVWASWCGPCREEMGSLERMSQRFENGQLRVIGISTDDYRDKAEKFLSRSGVSFRNYLDNKLLLEHMLGADRLPLTVLVDAQGRVIAKYYGAKDWSSAQALGLIAQQLRIKP